MIIDYHKVLKFLVFNKVHFCLLLWPVGYDKTVWKSSFHKFYEIFLSVSSNEQQHFLLNK